MQSLQEFCQSSGLKTAFVRKCISSIHLLDPHVHRGEKNKLLLDDNAVRIFDEITRMKEDGLSLPDIQKQLDEPVDTVPAKELQDAVKTDATHGQTAAQTELFQHYKTELDALRTERAELSQQLLDLTRKNAALQGELKALPAGKTPAELRNAYEQEQEQRRKAARITGELHSLSVWRWTRRRELLKALEELLS